MKKRIVILSLALLILIAGCTAQSPSTAVQEISNEKSCIPTAKDSTGPYYIADAPFRSNLAPGILGDLLVIEGTVLDTKCNPIPNVVLDLWHAGPNGDYDFSENLWFRGQIKTDENGNYRFETVTPARYGTAGFTRPAHIHIKIKAESYDELTTQMYFDEDSSKRPTNNIELVKLEGRQYGQLNIVLE